MKKLLHKILYRTLSLEGYLRVVSRLYFLCYRLGIGRRSPAMEYAYHLPRLVRTGDTAIDIGANLGYYARPLSRLAGPQGKVYAVEPVPVIGSVLRRNLEGCTNVEILPFALGAEEKTVTMGNDTPHGTGYFATGQNFVNESGTAAEVVFTARMRRGSELFASLGRLDFIKCDIEGYEAVVLTEMRPLLERFRPTVLVETGGENRALVVKLFTELGYSAFTLEAGRETPLRPQSRKDIIFRAKSRDERTHAYKPNDI